MENTPAFLVFLLLFVISFSFLLFFVKTSQSRKYYSKHKLPPAPPKFPIIGNLQQLGALPHRSLRALSDKYGPLMLIYTGNVRTLVISLADIVKEIFKTHDIIFSSRPKTTPSGVLFYNHQDIGFAPYGVHWKQLRKISVHELFSLNRVKEFQFIRDDEVAELVDEIYKAGHCGEDFSINLTKMFEDTSYNIISRCVIRKKFADKEGLSRFGELSKRYFIECVALSVGDFFPRLSWVDNLTGLMFRLRRIFNEMNTFLDEVLKEHEAELESSRGDGIKSNSMNFVDILVRLQKDGLLSLSSLETT